MEGDKPVIVIIGSGNVATNLAKSLDSVASVSQICSQNYSHAEKLASCLYNALPVGRVSDIQSDADFYIISTTDDAVCSVASQFPSVNGIVAHTSGSVSLNDLEKIIGDKCKGCGVFYPLQTFSAENPSDFSNIPLLLESENVEVMKNLTHLALLLNAKPKSIDSETRKHLHVAAVFANNFVNHLWMLSDKYLRENTDLDFSIFSELLNTTLKKALTLGPELSQTGPARRNDKRIIEGHLEILPDNLRNIYEILSESIIKQYYSTKF